MSGCALQRPGYRPEVGQKIVSMYFFPMGMLLDQAY